MQNADDTLLTPSQLNGLARSALEDMFTGIRVEGEIGNLARPASGHLYFTLKDARAQIRCALFKPKAQRLDFPVKDGAHVIVEGRVSLYEPRGDYQLIADGMVLAGEGELRRKLEALRQQLQAAGLFDPALKQPLPVFPSRIAVITSPSGAAIRDVLSVMGRRFPLLEVDVLPVQVQGATAAGQIREALLKADESGRYDAILLTRGGGSLEDLWAFNDEALVRAIAHCRTPVVSAVGHESDTTLSDFAADVRAATPSAAAELLTPFSADIVRRLQGLQRRLAQRQSHQMTLARRHLDQLERRLATVAPMARVRAMRERAESAEKRLHNAWTLIGMTRQRGIESARARLDRHHPRATLDAMARRLTAASRVLATVPVTQIAARRQHLAGLARALHVVSPLATVDRGYALITQANQQVVRSVEQVAMGDTVHARLTDGQLTLSVLSKSELP